MRRAPWCGQSPTGDRLAPTLAAAEEWLIRSNAAVMGVLLVVSSAELLGDAPVILA
jgi:hypothetical protein